MTTVSRTITAAVTIALMTGHLAGQAPTFRSRVDLITVDAAVHDGEGQPIAGLQPGDFRLEVDGRSRPVTFAQFVLQAPPEPPDAAAAPALAATHFTTNEGVTTGRVVVVAVDRAHIRRLEGRRAMVAATRFVNVLPPADRVGVIGLPDDAAVTFSGDRADLRRRLESMIGIDDPVLQQLNLGLSEALEIADGSRTRLADAVMRECGRALTDYVSTARAADDAGGGRDACPEQVEQESRGIAQYAQMRARSTVAALEALIDRLKDVPGPKTIVLVSGGMIVDPRRVDVSRLATLAQAARVVIYALQVELPVFEAADDRLSPTFVRDLQMRHDGVAQVAGAARGAVFRQVGSDPAPFDRILRELSGYYLLGFEARDGDRDGRAHRIRVSLARGGGELRARTGFTLPALTPASRGAQLAALLRDVSPATELPLRVATYTFAEPGGNSDRLRIVISAEAGGGAVAGTWLGFVLVDARGVIAATATHEAGDGRHAFSAVVPAGVYALRAAAVDPLDRQGSVERVFQARLSGTASVRLGDLLLAPPPPAPNAPLEPVVDRLRGTELVAYLEFQATAGTPRPDAVRVDMARPGGPALVSSPGIVSPGAPGWGIARARLPVGSVPPGPYVVRAEILAGGAVLARAERPITISER